MEGREVRADLQTDTDQDGKRVVVITQLARAMCWGMPNGATSFACVTEREGAPVQKKTPVGTNLILMFLKRHNTLHGKKVKLG